MSRLIVKWGAAAVLGLAAASGAEEPADVFSSVKQEFREAECSRVDFTAVLESDVFDTVDSTQGFIYFSSDGRYLLEIGPDVYLYEGVRLYSYSGEHNQVTIERTQGIAASPYEISLLRHLDELYETHIITPGREYRLIRKSTDHSNLPDSMRVYLDGESQSLDRLEYFDINDDLTRILIRSYEHFGECEDARFEADFPESAERIELDL